MTGITYSGITQGRAATSTLAITTPVSLKSILEVGGGDCGSAWHGPGWEMLMTDSWRPGSYITYAALTLGNVILLPLLLYLSLVWQ